MAETTMTAAAGPATSLATPRAIAPSISSFDESAPSTRDDSGARHWTSRGTNFVVVATRGRAGTTLTRDTVDESMLLLPAGTAANVTAGGETLASPGDALFIVPPGASTVRLDSDGWCYRIFTHREAELLARADHADAFAARNPAVAAPEPWPEPIGGYRLRHYPLARHARTDTTMRLFRSRSLMVNIFLPRDLPRDPTKLSPHSHVDIEQGSLALSGEYVHHLRFPWLADLTAWQDDEHARVGSPSLIIIPPTVVHTSQSVGPARSQLVDIFSPPRADFSLRPGLVCNADEYPLPAALVGAAPVAGE